MLGSSFKGKICCDGYMDYPFDKVYNQLRDKPLVMPARKVLV